MTFTNDLDGADTEQLLDDVTAFIRRYVVLASDAQATALALWVLHTWALDGAHATPYLIVVSPEKRTGKTRLLEVLELLIAKPWRVTSASEAAMFRKIDTQRPTLLLDEVDAIFGSHSERTEPLRAIVNSGNRPGAAVARCVGEGGNQRTVDFGVYCPKVLAGIDTGRLPDTIRDRGIEIRMERKTADEPVRRFRVRFAADDAAPVRERASAWAELHADALHAAVPDLPTEIDDRAGEAWEALFAIADLAGDEWPADARGAAIELAGVDRDDAPASAKALAAAHTAFDGRDSISTVDLLSALNTDDDLPFGGWNDGDGMKARDLARLLKRYRIKPGVIRVGDKTPRGYSRKEFAEAWKRYLPPTGTDAQQGATAQHPAAHAGSDGGQIRNISATEAQRVTQRHPQHATETQHETPDEHGDVADVADVADISGRGAEDGDVARAEALAEKHRDLHDEPVTSLFNGIGLVRRPPRGGVS